MGTQPDNDYIIYCITVYVEVVRHTFAPSVRRYQSAFAVTIVLGITPAGREVLVSHRSPLVQETLAVIFAQLVERHVRLNVADAHR